MNVIPWVKLSLTRMTSAAAAAVAKATCQLKICISEAVALAKLFASVAVNVGALWFIFRGLTATMDDFWTAKGALPLSTRWGRGVSIGGEDERRRRARVIILDLCGSVLCFLFFEVT